MRLALVLSAIAVSAPAWAQEASERAEIKQALESWYRIEQGLSEGARQHCGYAHERLVPVEGREWKYEYHYDSRGQFLRMREEEVSEDVEENIDAKLDAAFDILVLEGKFTRNAFSASLVVRAGASGRTAEITSLDGRRRTIAESGDTPVLYTLALALLRERQKGGLRAPATREVVLIDPAFEFDEMRMRRDVKAEVRLLEGERRTAVRVVPVEFRPARSTEAAKPVMSALLDRYGRVVEVVGEVESYVRTFVPSEREAKPAPGIERDGRRDPFKPVLTPKGEKAKQEEPSRPLGDKDRERLLDEVEALATKIMRLGEEDLPAADAAYEELYALWQANRKRIASDPLDQQRMDAAEYDAHRAVGLWDHEVRMAEKHLAAIRAAVEANDAKAAEVAFAVLRKLPERILGGRPPAEKLEKLAAEGGALLETMAARRELGQMKLVLAGTGTKQHAVQIPLKYSICIFSATSEIDTTVRMWVRDEWAIINDNSYRTGDVLPGTGVRIEKITSYSVTVSYKGVQRDLELSK